MPRLSRRNLLAAGAAFPTVSMLQGLAGTAAEAAAPINNKQAPGWYRYKVGAIESAPRTGFFRMPSTS